jgi:hypothetical protein
MHRDCDPAGSNGDRQKKGAAIGDAKPGEDPPAAPSGWLKIDSPVLQKAASAPTTTTTTVSPKSGEADANLEDDFVEEDVDMEAEVKKSFAAAAPPSAESSGPAQISSEPK